MAARRNVGFTDIPLVSGRLIGPALRQQDSIAPAFLHPQESDQPTPPHKITPESILPNFQSSKTHKMSPHYNNDNIDSFDLSNSFNKVLNNCTVADERVRYFGLAIST